MTKVNNDFESIISDRQSAIEAGSAETLPHVFPVNELAEQLHPKVQHLVVTKVETSGKNVKTFHFAPDKSTETKHLAYFIAGQYISLRLRIGDSSVTRPYAICSSPRMALNDKYIITVKRIDNGLVTTEMFNNWHVGTRVDASAPAGNLTYNRLRDAKTVIAIAGGSGITPFYSLASAIADGTENINLTILYGSRHHNQIMLKDELDKLAQKTSKVKVVNVLSDDESEGFEHGFITATLISRYTPNDDYSIFVSGPPALTKFMKQETTKLHIPTGRVRYELSGTANSVDANPDYPLAQIPENLKLTVRFHGNQQTISMRGDESLLVAMERAGIRMPSQCRNGECGICRAHVVSGQVFVPKSLDYRRQADKLNYVHTCVSYPITDVTLDISVVD